MPEQILNGEIEVFKDNSKALPWIAVHVNNVMVFIAHDRYSNETVVHVTKDEKYVIENMILGGASI